MKVELMKVMPLVQLLCMFVGDLVVGMGCCWVGVCSAWLVRLCSRSARCEGKNRCGCVGQLCLLQEYNLISWQMFLLIRWRDWLCAWLVRCRITVVTEVKGRWLPLWECLHPPTIGQGNRLVMMMCSCLRCW